MCVNYVGDCEGTIYPGEEKTCYNRELHLLVGFSFSIPTDGNTAGAAQSLSLSQQANNPMMHSQLNILKDIISHRTD